MENILNKNYFENEENAIADLNSKLDFLRCRKNRMSVAFNSINKKAFLDCFMKLKLVPIITSINLSGSTYTELKQNRVYISIVATPEAGCTIKPVIHNGYTRSGSSRNADKRSQKARILEAKIKTLTGLDCNINEYSMEVKYKENPYSILITLAITQTN